MKAVPLHFTLITQMPEVFTAYLNTGMMWKAQDRKLMTWDTIDPRQFGIGAHHRVDDRPYGGGNGMLMRCEPVFSAINHIRKASPGAKLVIPTPSGQPFHQNLARDMVRITPAHYIILCPRFEGYDARINTLSDLKISMGSYVMTGGELPALCIIDTLTRLIPGVLGGVCSAEDESFSDGDTLEYPQYTKPAIWQGLEVPEVLRSGNHAAIEAWKEAHRSQVPSIRENQR